MNPHLTQCEPPPYIKAGSAPDMELEYKDMGDLPRIKNNAFQPPSFLIYFNFMKKTITLIGSQVLDDNHPVATVPQVGTDSTGTDLVLATSYEQY